MIRFRLFACMAVFLLLIPGLVSGACSREKKGKETPRVFISGKPIDSLFLTMQARIYSNPDSIRALAREVYRVVTASGQTDWQIRMLNLLGVSYAIQSDLISAREYYHQALALSIQTNNTRRKGDTYSNLGALNFLTRSYTDALDNNLEAIDNYQRVGLDDKVAGIHCNIGILYSELNNWEKALLHYRAAYAGFVNLNDKFGISTVYNQMAKAYLKAGKPDSSLLFANKALDLSLEMSNWYSLASAYLTKAEIYQSRERYQQAIELYKLSEITAKRLNNRYLICAIELDLASLFQKRGMNDKALLHACNSMYLADSLEDNKYMQETRELISQIYSNMGDFKKGLDYYKEANAIKLKISDQSNLHQIYNLEINRLSKDKEVQQLDLEKKKLQLEKRNFTIIIICLVSVSVIVILILLYSRVRHKQNVSMGEASLRHAEERAQAVMEAEIQERRHLGIELHDGVGPMLSLAKLNLSAILGNPLLSQERKTKILNNTISTLDEILREIKHISQHMAPVSLIEKGFEPAIRELVGRLNATEEYIVNIDISGLKGGLGSNLEHTLYRAILELFNNVLLHAHGSEINLQVIQNHEDITVMLEDNGQGFHAEQAQGFPGMGLKSIRSRVEGLKGKMYIDSMQGRGTIITIVIPTNEKPGL